MGKYSVTVLIISFLACTSLFSQDINKFDENGKHHGKWIKYYEGKPVVRYEGQFEHGIPYGEFRYFYETGKLQTIATYSDNGTVCNTVSYFGNGTKLAEGEYINRQKNGKWVFYDGYGNMISTDNYKSGQKHGQCLTYVPTGQLIEEIYFDNGIQDGRWKRYYESGGVHFEGNVIQGKWEGAYVFYYPDGKKMVSGVYLHSLKQGDWLFYDEKGQLIKVETYDKGRMTNKKVFQKEKDTEYIEMQEAEKILEKMKSGVHDGPPKTPFD